MEQETGTRFRAVFRTEAMQVPGVGNGHGRCGLDLDGKKLVAAFDDEVDLLAGRGPPVMKLRRIDLSIPPGEEIRQDDVLEMRASGLTFLREIHGEAGVGPVRLGCLDEALGTVDAKSG